MYASSYFDRSCCIRRNDRLFWVVANNISGCNKRTVDKESVKCAGKSTFLSSPHHLFLSSPFSTIELWNQSITYALSLLNVENPYFLNFEITKRNYRKTRACIITKTGLSLRLRLSAFRSECSHHRPISLPLSFTD